MITSSPTIRGTNLATARSRCRRLDRVYRLRCFAARLQSAYGVIATANSRITPTGYKPSISTGWEAPWRSARIYQVLESGRKFSPPDMLALQNDIYSDFDHLVAERLARAVDHFSKPSASAMEAAETLRAWDGRMTPDWPRSNRV